MLTPLCHLKEVFLSIACIGLFNRLLTFFMYKITFWHGQKQLWKLKICFDFGSAQKALWATNNLSVDFFWVWNKNYILPKLTFLEISLWRKLNRKFFTWYFSKKVSNINLDRKLPAEISSIGKFKGFQIFACEFWKWFSFKTQKKHMKIFLFPRDPRNSCVTNIFVCNK